MTTKEYLKARKSREWKFNSIVNSDSYENVNKIHPIKQELVKKIVEAAKADRYVTKIIIFGSATRYDCDITSDLDICIDWIKDCYDSEGVLNSFTNNMRKFISLSSKGKADVVNFGYIEGTDIEEAVKEGVVVYEHNV